MKWITPTDAKTRRTNHKANGEPWGPQQSGLRGVRAATFAAGIALFVARTPGVCQAGALGSGTPKDGLVVGVFESAAPAPVGRGSDIHYKVVNVLDPVPDGTPLQTGDIVTMHMGGVESRIPPWQLASHQYRHVVFLLEVLQKDGECVVPWPGENSYQIRSDNPGGVAAVEQAGMGEVKKLRALPGGETAQAYLQAMLTTRSPAVCLAGQYFAIANVGMRDSERELLLKGLAAMADRPDAPHYVRQYAIGLMAHGAILGDQHLWREIVLEAAVTAFQQLLPEAGLDERYENSLLVTISMLFRESHAAPEFADQLARFTQDLTQYRKQIEAQGKLWIADNNDYPLYQWRPSGPERTE